MSDANWFSYVFGKFYSMGRIYYDAADQQFKDVSDLSMGHVPSYYSITSLLGPNRVCIPRTNQLPMEFEMALPLLPNLERNLLLEKFNLAITKLADLKQNFQTQDISNAFVVVSRKGTFVDYDSNSKIFVYVTSDQAEDEFYFATKIKPRNVDDNRLYIYFVFEGDQIEQ